INGEKPEEDVDNEDEDLYGSVSNDIEDIERGRERPRTTKITPRVSPRPAPRNPMDAYPTPAPEPGRYSVGEKPSETDTQVLPAMATPAKTPKPAAPVSPATPEPTQVINKSKPGTAAADSASRAIVS